MTLHSIQFANARRLAEALPTELISEPAKLELVARIARVQELARGTTRPKPQPRWYQNATRVAKAELKRRSTVSKEVFGAAKGVTAQLKSMGESIPAIGSGWKLKLQLNDISLQLTKGLDSFSHELHPLV